MHIFSYVFVTCLQVSTDGSALLCRLSSFFRVIIDNFVWLWSGKGVKAIQLGISINKHTEHLNNSYIELILTENFVQK